MVFERRAELSVILELLLVTRLPIQAVLESHI